jgi:hypothetical protein
MGGGGAVILNVIQIDKRKDARFGCFPPRNRHNSSQEIEF